MDFFDARQLLFLAIAAILSSCGSDISPLSHGQHHESRRKISRTRPPLEVLYPGPTDGAGEAEIE